MSEIQLDQVDQPIEGKSVDGLELTFGQVKLLQIYQVQEVEFVFVQSPDEVT